MSNSNDSAVEWEEPPSRIVRSGPAVKHLTLAEALREKPRQWAVFARHVASSSNAGAITTGRLKAFRPAGAFQGQSVNTGSGFDIYVCFVGDEK